MYQRDRSGQPNRRFGQKIPMKIDSDWFPIVALIGGIFLGSVAIFAGGQDGRGELVALATNLITMAGTAFGFRLKYSRDYED